MKISCIDKEVREILQTGYYQVPRFQRPYSWEKEHVDDFWQDSIANSEGDYFIGSIVVFKLDDTTKGIVDGQQRFTTITMLLCALRNAFKQLEDGALAQGIQKLIERPDINNKDQFVLQTETSYPYFQEHIQKFEPPDIAPDTGEEEDLLKNAFELLTANIDTVVDGIRRDESIATEAKKTKIKQRLSEIRDKILGLKLIFIELDNEDDAYLIFETLNTRGKDLTAADLVKNHVAKLIRTKNPKVDTTKDKWNVIVATLEDSEADLKTEEFLHHFWLSQFEYVTAKKLFKAIRKRIHKAEAKDFLDTLVKESRLYRQIMEPTFGKWAKEELPLQSSLWALNLFRVKQQIPMVLSVLREYHRGGIKLKHAINVLQAIENFHFSFTAITSQRSSGGISLMYALHARNLLAAKTLPEKLIVLKELKTKLQTKIPSYQEFEANFSELGFSEQFTKQKKLVQYVLSKFSCFFTTGVAIDPEKMTIEHLASQRSGTSSNMTHKEVACIGNLVLVDEPLNNKLKNKPFEEKKPILLRSNLPVDEKIRQATSWRSTEIQQRAKYMADLAYRKIWRIS
jgi:uncharacterized protein with ParB-like and HNH nuclease domain